MTIKIGSRESKLAVAQSELVMDAIRRAHPQVELTLVTMKTTGDKILDRTLEQIGGKGLFVRELDQALRDGRADFTVHSLKDLPMETPEDLPLVAFSKREDPRDCLVLPQGAAELDPKKPIGCASRRRQLQLKALYPHMAVAPVRGNVLTRLKKLDSGEFSALVLAAAGLKRLGLEGRITRYFAPTELSCLAGVGDPDAACCALAERAFVRALGGGCTSPVAAFATVEGETLTLTGLYVSEDETIIRRGSRTGAKQDAQALGEALAQALSQGGENHGR